MTEKDADKCTHCTYKYYNEPSSRAINEAIYMNHMECLMVLMKMDMQHV